MTTIAYRNGIIAADSQITYDKSVKGTSGPKIVQLNKNTVIACAGGVVEIQKMQIFFTQKNWEQKLDEAPKFKNYIEALLVYKGKVYICLGTCYPELLYDAFYALGSGYKFALAGMHLGLSAEEAVKFASTLDIYTDDKIQLFDVTQLQAHATNPKRTR